MFGNAPTPTPPMIPPEPANAPTFASSGSLKNSTNPSARPMGGMASTILTAPSAGYSPSATTKKSLLGQ